MNRLLIVSSGDPDDGNLISYYGHETQTGIMTYNQRLIRAVNSSSDADDFKEIIDDWIDLVPENGTTNWVVKYIYKNNSIYCVQKFGHNYPELKQTCYKLV